MTQVLTSVARLSGLSMVVLIAACGADGGEQETGPDLAEVQQEIKNGSIINANYGGNAELVTNQSNPWTFCSGTFVTNRWVVTAKHCVEDPDRGPGSFLIRMGNQTLPVVLVVKNPSAQEDIAMVATSSAALLIKDTSGTPTSSGYKRPFDTRSAATLDGLTLVCTGYGPGGSSPPLRQANLTADNLGGAHPLCMLKNSQGQMHEGGDSGGGCMKNEWFSIKPLTYVNSYCQQTFCCGDPAVEWASWANNVMTFFGG